ncbi:RT36-like protein [Mya arenaria]|uniref:RT36-like protein n=1 Tax=Mya arenaria TaxID=6604 RepID=A0ABY7DWJ2_MYAAR|nr:alpha-ketoglutarate dehydrogenase component 4-like [Mya arenaria]WAR00676.1 RT36-like protein [Mya arenaria]
MKMSTLTRAVQAVKPHVPLIRFPSRSSIEEAMGSIKGSTAASAAVASPPSFTAKPPANSYSDVVPARFQRKPISLEEMDYIQRGGPE